jgi:hypothetical protein
MMSQPCVVMMMIYQFLYKYILMQMMMAFLENDDAADEENFR